MIPTIATRARNKAYTLFQEKKADICLDRGMVSFTFDDFPADALHVGGSILEDAGWRGTYYVAAELRGTEGPVGRIFDANDLVNCVDRGHELANHSLTHLRFTLADGETVIHEVLENKRILPAATTLNFAYPFGSVDTRVMRILSHHVTTARGVRHGINGLGTVIMNLRANPIYSCIGLDKLFSYVEQNSKTPGWLIFYTHDVNDTPSQFGCTPKDFSALVQAVKSTDFDVVTIEEGRKRLQIGQ